MERKKRKKKKKEGHVSVNASKKDNEGAGAGVQVADTGLFSLLGPSRTRCASASVPPAVLDMS
jgi:hypothetical protein